MTKIKTFEEFINEKYQGAPIVKQGAEKFMKDHPEKVYTFEEDRQWFQKNPKFAKGIYELSYFYKILQDNGYKFRPTFEEKQNKKFATQITNIERYLGGNY